MASEDIPFDQLGATGEDIGFTSGLGGRGITIEDRLPFLAKITANNPVGGINTYSWVEQQPFTDGSMIQAYNPRQGTNTYNPAYEINNGDVPTGSIVWMTESYVDNTTDMNYVFAYCCGATVTITLVTNVCAIVLP